MRLVFTDESGALYPSFASYQRHRVRMLGTAGGDPARLPDYPMFLVVAAVSFPESHRPMVDQWFDRQRISFLGGTVDDRGPEFEIKGQLLYSLLLGRTPHTWAGAGRRRRYTGRQARVWGGMRPVQLQALAQNLFDLFRRLRPVIWAVVVRQADIYARHGAKTWPPHLWALTYLQQRAAQHVEVAHGAYDQGLFIMDQHSSLSKASDFDEFLSVRQQINATSAWPVDFRKHLIDVPLPSQSHLIQPLQLADVVAHSISRKVHNDDPLGWFAQLAPFLATHWSTGTYDRAGLTTIG